ncbi:GTP binding protein [Mortierella alpina]|nr:GTP binding protein [Mortierella alpina]
MAAFQLPASPLEQSPWVNHQGSLPPEIDIEGNIEYKLKLIATAPDRFEHLVTQLKWRQARTGQKLLSSPTGMRLSEGHGSAIYEIGVADDGSFVGLSPEDMEISLQTLHRMADFLKADVTILRRVSVESTQPEDGSAPGIVRKHPSTHISIPRTDPEYLVVEAKVTSRLADEHHFMEIRVALVGGPDAGKSTLLGRLAHGIADNGRGKARLNLLRHRHEISSGRTSSISHEIMGFTAKGETVNYSTTNISSWQEVCESSAKVVTLLDTCGHPRFLKTTISGLTGHSPDYACLVVDSRVGGVSEMTREHLALAVALGLPTFVVVTKMDVATREQLRATASALMALIRSTGPSCLPFVDIEAGFSSTTLPSSTSKTSATGIVDGAIQKFVPVIVHKENDLEAVVDRFSNVQTIDRTNSVAIPILLLSSVTGENVNLLEKMLRLLPKPSLDDHGGAYSQEPACYQIEEIYNIPDIGTVVGGFLHSGRIQIHKNGTISKDSSANILQGQARLPANKNMRLYLGPVDRDGSFIPVVVKSIHRQRMSMRSIDSGQTATLAIEGPGLGRVKVRRGMVVLESDTDPRGTCCQTFEAIIQVLAHEGAFGVGYHGMIHCGSVHQNAKVVKIDLLPSPGQEDDISSSLDSNDAELAATDIGPATVGDRSATLLRSTSRASNCDSIRSARSSSVSSDYESGTGSSVTGSVALSRSSSFRRTTTAVPLDDENDHDSSMPEDQQSHQRPRQRQQKDASHVSQQQHGMVPISTMRNFRRLSFNRTGEPTVAAHTNGRDENVDEGHEPATSDQEQDVELRSGSRARIVFRFCHEVVFMREGTTVLFRHGGTKCVGKVIRML